MANTYSAGIVTAYGAAKRGGYTGTYDQFCAALGDLANVLEDFESFQAQATTLPEGSAATASYENGVLTLGIPKGDKGDTGNGISSISLVSTVGLVKTYRITYTNGDTFDYAVTNGNGITSTSYDSTNHTLTLTFDDGTSFTTGSLQGETGATPDISIGTVTTLPAGSSATAQMTGTPEAPILNLGIPKGADGDVSAASMAKAYSTSDTYAVGEYCWYSGQLYECVTAITTAESWTAAHWKASKIAEDVSDLNRQLSDLETQLKSGDEEDADLHLGFYLDENGDLCQVDEEVNNG